MLDEPFRDLHDILIPVSYTHLDVYKRQLKMKPDIQAAILALEADDSAANRAIAATLRKQNSSHPQKDRSFHYLPYHTDSPFEQDFLNEVLLSLIHI